MKRVNFFITALLLISQFLFSQEEVIPLEYDTSGYQNNVNTNPLARVDSSPNDTIPSIKGEMGVNEIGGLTYMLPLEVMKGVNNFQPNLALGYNSQAGNGQAGWGWNIVGISLITQGGKSKYIDGITIGNQFNPQDPFYLDGQRLIQTSTNTFETEKYSKIKITKNAVGAEYSFVIQYTDGKIANFKELITGQHYISKLIDALGNEIHYTYVTNTNVPSLSTVSYGGTSISNDKFFVNFNYSNRLVPIKSYRNGVQYISSKALNNITITSSYLTDNSGLYRKYLLTYDYIQSNTVERLIKIQVENENGVALKPLKFGYNTSNSAAVNYKWTDSRYPGTYFTYGGVTHPVLGLGSVALGDFYGNGDLTPIYETKYGDSEYRLFNSKSGTIIEGYGQSRNLYTGRALFDNKISDNDVLISSSVEHLGVNFSTTLVTGLIDKLTFKVLSLAPAKSKSIVINLPGGFKQHQSVFHPYMFSSSSWVPPSNTNNSTFYFRDRKERKILSGDFNNDALFDVIIIEHENLSRQQKIYFCEIGKAENGTVTPILISSSPIVFDNNFYQIEFDGDGIPEILTVNKDNGTLSVYKFNSMNNTLTVIPNVLNSLSNFSKKTPILFGDYNGDGLTDFITPQRIYDINGSTITNELAKINSEQQLWWEYISTGTTFIKTQRDYTTQKLAYFNTSQRNIIKESSNWDKFWSGKPDSYEYTEYGTSGIIPVDFNNDGKTDLVSVNCFGTVKYDLSGNIMNTQLLGNYTSANKIIFHVNKTLVDGSHAFNNIGNVSTNINNVSPLSLIVNYNDFNQLNSYKSGIRIYDVIAQRDVAVVVNNDSFKEGQIQAVDNGSPVKQVVEYKPMVEKSNNNQEDMYSTTNLNLDYPYHVNKNLGVSYLVNKMHTVFDDKIITKEYRYENGVQNLNGKGFLGFQKTIISDPYESIFQNGKYKMKNLFTAHFWRVNTFNPLLENAMISSTYGSLNMNSIFSKSQLTNQRFDKGNNRYLILTTSEINTDYLKNIIITKSFDYDVTGDLLLKQINTNYSSQGSSIEKFTYGSEFNNGSHYFFGKIIKTENTTFRGSDSFSTKEEQIYNTNGTVGTLKKYGNGTLPIITDFTYYPFGEIQTRTISTAGITSLVTSFEYDITNRFLIKTISPDLLQSTMNVDVIGKVISNTSPLGHLTQYKYDNWGNLKETTDFLGKKTIITKNITPTDPLGYYSISTKREGGIEMISIFDVFNRLIKKKTQTINNQWIINEFQYDVFGKKIKECQPYFQGETPVWNTTEYDYLDRPIKVTAFNGKIINTCYEGLKATVEDGHKKTSKWVDAMGNTVKVKDGGGEIFYKYYPNGALKETNYEGIVTSVEIDGWGNKTKLIDPSAGTYNYEYDNFSRIKKEINPKGGTTIYTYDATGKLITENTNSPSENTIINRTYSYDSTTKLPIIIDGTYNGKSYTYTTFYEDPYFRVTKKTEQTPDFFYESKISYDTFGNVDETELKTILNSPSYTTTSKIKNNYDVNGILINQFDTQTGSLIWEINTINSNGQTTEMEFGNGYTLQTNYNSSSLHLEKIKHFSSTQNILEINYNYDNLKNVLNSRENITFSKNETYQYDDLDRLLQEAVNGIVTQQYTFDERGRMTSNSSIGKYNYNEQDYKLQNINFNPSGSNLNSTRGFAEIQYNSFKNPTEIYLAGKDRISFEYSILKTRSVSYYGSLSTTATSRPNRKFYSSDKAVEIIKEGVTTKIITYITGDAYSASYMKVDILNNGSLVSNNKYFLHRDNQGTILAISKADINGTVIEKRYFDAWGNLKGAKIGTTFHAPNALGWVNNLLIDRGYTGHEHLKTVGLIHMNGRIYDPALRRFLSPDNNVQDPYNSQSYNRFGYVFNNPLLYTDPSGEIAFLAAVGIAVAVAIIINGVNNSINGTPFWYGTGRAGTMGAISGAISFGIGSIATSTFTNVYSQASFQAAMHATTGGIMSEIEGGSFASGFASGAISSMVSSSMGFIGRSGGYWNDNCSWSTFGSRNSGLLKAITITSGGLSGGIGSTIAGGNFWSGVRQGLITTGLNHMAHAVAQKIHINSNANEWLKNGGYEANEYIGEMDQGIRGDYIKQMRQNVIPLDILYDDAGNPELKYYNSLTDYGSYESGTVSIYSKAFDTNKTLFLTILHEGVHAWDDHHGLIAAWGGVEKGRAITETRAYEMMRYFDSNVFSNYDHAKYYKTYSTISSKSIFNNFRIQHYPTFFNNIQR